MKEESKDYKFCINLAIDNAKKRIDLLDKMDQKCIIEEYKEWIKDGLNYQSVLLLREDPIIWLVWDFSDYFSLLEVTLNKENRLNRKTMIRIIVKREKLYILSKI